MDIPSCAARRCGKLIASLLASSLTAAPVLAPLASAQSAASLRPQMPSDAPVNGAGVRTGPSATAASGMNLSPSLSLSLPAALPSIEARETSAAKAAPAGAVQARTAPPASIGPALPKSSLAPPAPEAGARSAAAPGNARPASPAIHALQEQGASVAAAVSSKKEAAEQSRPEGSFSKLSRALGRMFDGSRMSAASPSEAASPQAGPGSPKGFLGTRPGAAPTVTRRSPSIPLPTVSPAWRESQGPASKALTVRFEAGQSEELGRESEIGASQDLSVTEVKGALAVLSASERGEDKVSREVLISPSAPKGAQMTETGVAWLGSDGALYVRDAQGKEYAIRPAQGRVREFALSSKNNHVYVLTGDSLQRWDLSTNKATVLTDERIEASRLSGLHVRQGENGAEAAQARSASLRVTLKEGVLSRRPESPETIHDEFGAVSWLKPSADSLYIQKLDDGARLWRKTMHDSGAPVEEVGVLPFEVKAAVEGPGNGILFAAADEGLVEWDTRSARYRLFQVPGLKEAAAGGSIRLEMSADGGQALLGAGSKFFRLDLSAARSYLDGDEARVRLWAQANPMSISAGALHIGDFSFPIRVKEPVQLPWRKRAWAALKRALGLSGAPAEAEAAGFSEKEWKAVNLPANKWVIYQTLKAFTLRQHVLYIGETGGGKTWVAEMLAKLTGNDLWMASLNEYTKNQDLIARETFGEEGRNKTGLTPSVALQWMMNGGILLLDEMHKPLEGIAVLNNILQNGEYRMADGRVIRYDKSKSFVIGTMNPVKPPYRGEPPSGELSSRFGMTLEVKYLPAEEEAALLSIFHDKVPKPLLEKLVAIAADLRKVYPETLPLPIAPRTLMHIAQHMSLFPDDDPTDIFTASYNPASIVEDPAIQKAIRRALEAHGFGRQAEKKSPVTPKA